MFNKIFIFLLMLMLSWSADVSAQDIDLLWKARALQAGERIKKLEEILAKNSTSKTRMEMMLEFAYGAIVIMSDMTVKKTPRTLHYHLVINYGDDGLLDVVYMYDSKTQEYIGVRIDRLPKNRSITLVPSNGDIFAIGNTGTNTKEPMVIFSKKDPFGALVAARGQ